MSSAVHGIQHQRHCVLPVCHSVLLPAAECPCRPAENRRISHGENMLWLQSAIAVVRCVQCAEVCGMV